MCLRKHSNRENRKVAFVQYTTVPVMKRINVNLLATSLIQSDMSQQLLDGLLTQNLVQMFEVPSGWILQPLALPWLYFSVTLWLRFVVLNESQRLLGFILSFLDIKLRTACYHVRLPHDSTWERNMLRKSGEINFNFVWFTSDCPSTHSSRWKKLCMSRLDTCFVSGQYLIFFLLLFL